MKNSKIISLTKYLNELKIKLESPVSDKHKHAPEEYKAFLKREIKLAERTLENSKTA